MNIRIDTDIPDSTYFTMSDVEPYHHAETGELVVLDGRGSHRSWGSPQVSSAVVINDDDFTAIHVGFSHKHRGSQGWFYFVGGERKTWAQLSDAMRQRVLDSKAKAPGWAKSPGKLRADHAGLTTRTAYKLVKLEGDRMVSLFDAATEYTIGKKLTEKAQPEHGGGYYAYPTADGCKALWNSGSLVPSKYARGVQRLALLEVEVSGTIIEYGQKLAATHIKPIRVVEHIEVANV